MSSRTATSQIKAREVFSHMPMDMLKDIEAALENWKVEPGGVKLTPRDRRLQRYARAATRARKERQAGFRP